MHVQTRLHRSSQHIINEFTALDPEYESGPPGGGQPGQYDPNDGYVTGRSNASLADAKTTAYSANDNYSLMNVGQYYYYSPIASYWYCYRTFLKFNTTSIPENAIITSAKLLLYLAYDYSTYADFTIRLQKWTGDTPIGTEDFNAFDGVNYDDGTANTANMIVGAYNPINIANFNLINKGGYTKICVRSSRDIECVGPPAGRTAMEYVQFSTTEGVNYPKLLVTYIIPTVKIAYTDGLVCIA